MNFNHGRKFGLGDCSNTRGKRYGQSNLAGKLESKAQLDVRVTKKRGMLDRFGI